MRTVWGVLVAALLTIALVSSPAQAADAPLGGERMGARGTVVPAGAPALPALSAAGWLIADLDTGEVLAARDPHGRYAPASTLKVLTAHTVIPKLDPLTVVRPTFDDVNVEGSKVGLVPSFPYAVRDLIKATLVVSGNDAANALATANGGVAKTVAEMNAEAKRLRAFDTRAANTNGLDAPGQLSSPYDLALIGRAAMQRADFRDYVRIKRSTIPAPGGKTIAIASHDRLLWNYDGAIGIKNGYTSRARATFVGAATRGGRTLIISLMKANPRYWPEAAALLDWGFAATRAGVQPVGQLVDPEPELQQLLDVAEQQSVLPAAATTAVAQTEGGWGRTALTVLGALLATVAVLRARVRIKMHRRRKRRQRAMAARLASQPSGLIRPQPGPGLAAHRVADDRRPAEQLAGQP